MKLGCFFVKSDLLVKLLRPGNDGAENRAGEYCAVEVGASEIHFVKPGTGEVRPRQIGVAEVCPREHGSFEGASVADAPLKVGCREFEMGEVAPG